MTQEAPTQSRPIVADEADYNRVVALYDFDPSTIDWPFKRQSPLPLHTGMVIEIMEDDGSAWAFGFGVGNPEVRGFFPLNYTVTVPEYKEMMHAYQEEMEGDIDGAETEPHQLLPAPTVTTEQREIQRSEQLGPDEPELVGRDLEAADTHPVLAALPPVSTTFELTKSRMLNEMPCAPDHIREELAAPEDDIVEAREEYEQQLRHEEDPNAVIGGKLSYSRSSTPATYKQTRPEHDFVRRQIPMEKQSESLLDLSELHDIVRKQVTLDAEEKTPYPVDLRVRFTTIRVAQHLEPPHMRFALQKANLMLSCVVLHGLELSLDITMCSRRCRQLHVVHGGLRCSDLVSMMSSMRVSRLVAMRVS
jgi:hypothetical protein